MKVLDFGLAKALDPNPDGDPSQSLTLTAAATQIGVIMGTAAYMSPVQAAGKVVDKRGDIWSFGVVLMEMLTGQRLFTGETVSHVLAKVLDRDLDFTVLPTATPTPMRRLLRRCLERMPRRRLADIGEAIIHLEEAAEVATEDTSDASANVVAPVVQRSVWQHGTPWAVGALLVGSLVTGLSVWAVMRPAANPPTRFTVESPPGLRAIGPVLSPDGRTIAFRGFAPGGSSVYLRSLSELEAIPLRGGEDGWPSGGVSPDGQFLLFTDMNPPRMLQRVPLDGGPGTPITADPDWGSDWGSDSTIVQGSTDGLWVVPASGGERTQATAVAEGETSHANPHFLPNGRDVLFHVLTGGRDNSLVAVYDSDTGEHRTLVPGVSPQFAGSGHLMFWRDGSLWAAPFDPERLDLVGTPVPVVEGVWTGASGFGGYDVGTDGTLVFVPEGQGANTVRTLVWVDREGQEEPIGMTPRVYNMPQVSPDGTRLVVGTQLGEEELFLYDLETQVEERFTLSRTRSTGGRFGLRTARKSSSVQPGTAAP